MRGLCVVSGMFCVPPRVFVSVVRSKRSESLCLPKVANVRLHCDSFRRLSDMSYGMSIQIARTPKDPRAKMQIQKYFLGFSPCELTADGPRSAYFGGSARGLMDRGGKWKGCDPTVPGVGCPWLHGRKPSTCRGLQRHRQQVRFL